MTVGDRIKELIALLRHNPFSFAIKIGVSSNMIYNIIGGRRSSPSSDLMEKMKLAFPEINMNWVIAGIGKPIANTQDTPEISVEIQEIKNRMRLLEELAETRHHYVSVLRSRVNDLKKEVKSKGQKKGTKKVK